MADYISRTLTADKGTPNERLIDEGDLGSLPNPLVILGEPGIGKTELTQHLEQALGGKRVAAGTFSRTENLSPYAVQAGIPIIIDGLDEVSATSGESPLDGILRKLDRLGRPRFIISCRAADWQGTPDQWKIEQDYGARPITLHIAPFSHAQARRFIAGYDSTINPQALLNQIADRGLQELIGNPLTLGLLAEVSLGGEGLPESKTKLLERASRLLVKEQNPAHSKSQTAQARVDDLLLSAGAVAACLLISGASGVSTGQRESLPVGFVHSMEVEDLPDAPLTKHVLRTRIFRTEGEGLFLPVHRVIAEYLGAYWLSRRLQAGLSERRLFQALEFSGGVPTALRGLHAWLGYFTPTVSDRCIRTDPYGVLRYGEIHDLPIPRARLLLSSLAVLAKEDPYFRSEDWGTRAVSGLARSELKSEIISVVRSPDRHLHLSSLLLESILGSALTHEIVPELLELIRDSSAAYSQREHAAEALIVSRANIDWTNIAANLRTQGDFSNRRLALEIISQLKGNGFTTVQIADALLDVLGIDSTENYDGLSVSTHYELVDRLSATQCAGVLDGIADRIAGVAQPYHWSPNHHLASTIQRLAAKALEGAEATPARFWSWVRFVSIHSSYSEEPKERIRDYLRRNVEFRRQVQRTALSDQSIERSPWMTIVHNLPQANRGLAMDQDDAAELLREIVSKDILTNEDCALWTDLARAMGGPDRHTDTLAQVIHCSTDKHPRLAAQWKDINRPQISEWEKEEQLHQANYRKIKANRFAQHRADFAKVKDGIASGKEVGALCNLALAYLGHYSDLDRDAIPIDRLHQWVGDDITDAATKGFVAALSWCDLPTIDKIAEVRNEGKHWTIEPVMICGVAELVRTGQSLKQLSEEVAKAILAIWWDSPEFDSTKLGEDIEKQLEDHVFYSDSAAEDFLVATLEVSVKSGKDHINGLYRLRDARFRRFAAPLALRWLKALPQATNAVQRELLQICMHEGAPLTLTELIMDRLANISNLDEVAGRIWSAAAFILNRSEYRIQVEHRYKPTNPSSFRSGI